MINKKSNFMIKNITFVYLKAVNPEYWHQVPPTPVMPLTSYYMNL